MTKNPFLLLILVFLSGLGPGSTGAAYGGGQLTPAISTPTGTANLTIEGTVDWVHWGKDTAASVNRKAVGAAQIGSLTLVGGSATRFNNTARLSYRWSDGTPPTGSATTQAGLYIAGEGKGFELKVPADTSDRTLVVYLGGWKARGRIEASLSDGTPAFVQTVEDLTTHFDRRVALSYRAASAGQTLTVRYLVEATSGEPYANITFQAATLQGAAAPALMLPFADDFSDGNMNGWVVFDETTNNQSEWVVIDGSLRQTRRIGSIQSFDQTYHLGSHAYLQSGLPLTDYRFSVEAEYLETKRGDDIGILFRYRDPTNFYRLSINSGFGFTRLEKRVNGVYSPLANDSRGYLPAESLDLEVEVRGSKILVWRNGEPLFAVEDESHSSGTVGLYTQDQARFDNVSVDSASTAPALVLASPLAYLTSSGSSIRASAVTLNAPVGGTVDFSLNGIAPVADPAPPYEVTFPFLAPGNYEVTAVLRDGSGAELASDTNSVVGIGGEYFVSIGDSNTNGTGDNFQADNLSLLGRIIGWRGYQGGLADLLDSTASSPTQLVFNEGIGGDKSYEAAYVRVDSIIARHPEMDTALVLLGTNDATGGIPSGQNCSGTSCNGTFKQNMQTLVDKLAASGTTPVVALPPPAWTSTSPWTSSTNNRIRQYISVIKNELVGIALGPDFFSFFMPSATAHRRSLFSDTLHPNALGHRVMAYLWHNALSPSVQQPLPFLLGSLGLSSGRLVQQNLLEVGDSYYIDEAFTLGSIPAVLAEGRWVMTANADRNSTAANYVTFDVDRAVDVYIAYDAGAAGLPAWMSGFLDTGLSLTTSNAAADSFKLYRATYGAGAITLGGNLSGSATGAETNYVVIVVERP